MPDDEKQNDEHHLLAAKPGRRSRFSRKRGEKPGTSANPESSGKTDRISHRLDTGFVAVDNPATWHKKLAKYAKHHARFFLVGAGSFLVVAVLVLYIVKWKLPENSGKSNADAGCAQKKTDECESLRDSVILLKENKIAELSNQVKKNQTLTNYKKNSNLLYITTAFYIKASDASNAQKSLELLKKAYSEKEGYDQLLFTIAAPPDKLGEEIKLLAETKSISESNFWGVKEDGTVQQGVQMQ